MLFPEFQYVGFKTIIDRKTAILPLGLLPTDLDPAEEAYASVYRFDESIARLPSLASLPKGTLCYPDELLFDFDSKDLALAHSDAKTLCERLGSLGVRYSLYFSGGKGFHVAVPSIQADIRPTSDVSKIKELAETLAGDLDTFDPSVYNQTRVFRVTGSFNKGGGFFKSLIPLTATLEEIKAIASECRDTWNPEEDADAYELIHEKNKVLVDLYATICAKQDQPVAYSRVVADQDPRQNGSLMMRAEEGRRNETAYTVARRLARRGIPLADAREVMATVWNGKACQPPLPTAELLRVVENAYSKGVNEFVDEGSYAGKITSISSGLESVSKRFLSHQTGFLTGYEMIDNYTMGFGPEELIWIAGRSGSFKSAVLTNILQRGSKLAKKHALYFSMEMGPETLIPRTIQQSHGITKKDVVTAMRAGIPYTEFSKAIEDFEYVKFVYLSNLTTEQILGLIDYHIETYGELSAIGIDYLGLFRGVNNNTERTAKQAQELKTVICKAARCPVFCLVQAKQVYEGREGDIELDRSCPKDSDSILDLGDYAMGLWGHWSQNPDTGEEAKYQFGKFFKSRGMNEELYGVDPYFGLNLDKRYMRLNDVVYIPNPPQFKRKGSEKDE